MKLAIYTAPGGYECRDAETSEVLARGSSVEEAIGGAVYEAWSVFGDN